MKYITVFSIAALLFIGLSVSAQTIPSVSPWLVDALGNITQRVANTPVRVVGNLTVTGTCTGCGGGSGSTGLASTTPWTPGQLAEVISNALVGGVSTSTLTAGTGLTGSFTQVGSGGALALSIPVVTASGGTGTTTGGVTNGVEYFNGTTLTNNANLTFNGSLLNLTGNASTTQFTSTGNTYLATAGGNVGIGTTSPYAKLSVAGNVLISGTSYPGFNLIDSATDNTWYTLVNTSLNDSYAISLNANADALVINTSGYVGIGTTTPTNPLTLAAGSLSVPALSFGDTGTGFYRGTINAISVAVAGGLDGAFTTSGLSLQGGYLYNNANINNASVGVPTTGVTINRNIADANTALTVYQQNAGSTGDILDLKNSAGVQGVVTQAGSLGIGTTSPFANLAISDNTANPQTTAFVISSSTASATTTLFSVSNTGATNIMGLLTTSGGIALASQNVSGGNTIVSNNGNGYELLGGATGATAPILLPNRGDSKAGIGADTSGDVSIIVDNSGTATELARFTGTSVLFNGGNVGIGTTTPWGQLSVNPNGVTGPAFVVGSSTATNFIVTNGGNVGIGTTSPYAALSIGGGNLVLGSATAGGTQGDLFLPKLGTAAGAFLAVDGTGKVIATSTPSGSNSAFSPAANYATTGTLPSYTYAAGVITAAGVGALSVDGANPSVGQLVLVKNESGTCTSSSGGCNNGLYTVTTAGSGIAAFVLTRSTSYNSSSNVIPGIVTYIISGTANSDDFWAMTSAAPITIGTTALTYTEVSGGGASVTSVSNSDSTLTISPTSGAVIASLNLSHANTWSALQTFGNSTTTDASFSYASSTLYYGANLASCSGATSALTWSGGMFGCNTISSSNYWSTAGGTNGGIYNNTGLYLMTGTTTNSISGPSSNGLVQFQSIGLTKLSGIYTSSFKNDVIGILGASGDTTGGSVQNGVGIWGFAQDSNNAEGDSTYGIVAEDLGATSNNTSGDYALYVKQDSSFTSSFKNYAVYSTGGENYFSGNTGIGSTSPGTLLSIGNTGGINFNPTATSTFSASANGINITNGCYAVGGTCLGLGTGTVTSVSGSGGTTGLTLTGGAITTSGTLTIGGTLGIANGGTGSTTAPVGQVLYGGATSYQSVATSSETCSSPLSCTSFNHIGAGGAISLGTVGIANGGTGTTTGGVFNGVEYWNNSTLTNNASFVDSNGDIGIGTTSPAFSLEIASTTGSQLALSDGSATSAQWAFRNVNGNLYIGTTSPTTYATSTPSGIQISSNSSTLFGIGTTSPWRTLSVAGTVAFPGLSAAAGTVDGVCLNTVTGELEVNSLSNCTVSSERFKHDINRNFGVNALQEVMEMTPASFVYNGSKITEYGFIAEDMQKVDPKLVGLDKTGQPSSLDDVGIMAVMVKAMQTQQREIQAFQRGTTKDIQDSWQWVAIGILAIWNLYLTHKCRHISRIEHDS